MKVQTWSSGSAGLWGHLAWALTGLVVLVKDSCRPAAHKVVVLHETWDTARLLCSSNSPAYWLRCTCVHSAIAPCKLSAPLGTMQWALRELLSDEDWTN